MTNWLEVLSAAFSAATAVGVFLAVWQIWATKVQSVIEFEDSIAGEYRELAAQLPLNALLGENLEGGEYDSALELFYRYFDLSNEQVFLRQNGRITPRTWSNWCDGIRAHMKRPAFHKAWEEVKKRSNSDFAELRLLEEDGFTGDPRAWETNRRPALPPPPGAV
jgi:hypothetical protein